MCTHEPKNRSSYNNNSCSSWVLSLGGLVNFYASLFPRLVSLLTYLLFPFFLHLFNSRYCPYCFCNHGSLFSVKCANGLSDKAAVKESWREKTMMSVVAAAVVVKTGKNFRVEKERERKVASSAHREDNRFCTKFDPISQEGNLIIFLVRGKNKGLSELEVSARVGVWMCACMCAS